MLSCFFDFNVSLVVLCKALCIDLLVTLNFFKEISLSKCLRRFRSCQNCAAFFTRVHIIGCMLLCLFLACKAVSPQPFKSIFDLVVNIWIRPLPSSTVGMGSHGQTMGRRPEASLSLPKLLSIPQLDSSCLFCSSHNSTW